MPDRLTFEAHASHSAYRTIAHLADAAFVEGHENLCIELIETFYRLLDEKLARPGATVVST